MDAEDRGAEDRLSINLTTRIGIRPGTAQCPIMHHLSGGFHKPRVARGFSLFRAVDEMRQKTHGYYFWQ